MKLEAAPIRISHDDLSTCLTHKHVGGVIVPIYEVNDLYFRLELDQGYLRLDHEISRLDMSRPETLQSVPVTDPAPVSTSTPLILAMFEIIAQIDKIAMPVPNNQLPYPLS
jgi:hypothetical protein